MGKTRHRRHRGHKPNPTGLPSVKSVLQEEDEVGEEEVSCSSLERNTTGTIQEVAEQLQSAGVEHKECGLITLATLFEDPTAIEELLREGIIKTAMSLLVDASAVVRHAAAGALRNLSASGSHEICDAMVDQDIMTPLVQLLLQYSGEWLPIKKADSKKIDTRTEIFVQAVHLLWNLCESNSTAVRVFNQQALFPVLSRCLDISVYPPNVVVAAAHCLHTVSEDNVEVISQLSEIDSKLYSLLRIETTDPDSLLIRVLISGILLNMHYGRTGGLQSTIVGLIMSSIASALAEDHRKAASHLADHLASQSRRGDVEQKELANVETLLCAQQTAVEILINICSVDDGDDDWEQMESSDTSSDDIFVDEEAVGEPMVTSEKFPLSVTSEVHEAICSHQLIQKVLEKANLPVENVCQMLKDTSQGSRVLKKIAILRCRAFLCFNNLVYGLDIDDLGGASDLYDIWMNLGKLVFVESGKDDESLLEAATSAMRAVVQRLAEVKCPQFHQLTVSDIQLLFSCQQQCGDASVRANLLRISGVLGLALVDSESGTSRDIAKAVGTFLLDSCFREPEVWVIAEALDTLMDLFGEDETDAMAAEIGLVERLRNLLPTLKSKVNQQKRTLGDHFPIVMTAKTNLSRFIKYKSNRGLGKMAANGNAATANGHGAKNGHSAS